MTDETPTLSCVTEFIVDCLHKTAPIQETGFPLIRTPNIGKGRFNLDGVYRISQETYDKWTIRAVPQKNDLIMAREAPAGNVAIIKSDEPHCLGQRTVHIRPNPELIDPDFLTYFLVAPRQQAALLKNQIGVHVGHVNMKDIRKLPLEDLPPMEEQMKRAQIISKYDDLIENNKRRIELLEESARQLYKEWFVRFRFPGHEHVKIIDGVPDGWKKTTADQAIEILSGGTPKTKVPDYWNGDISFYTPKDSTNTVYVSDTEKTITSLGLEKCASKLYPKDTLFITARGTVGKLNLAQKPMAMNQSCYALVGKEPVNQIYLFFAMQAGIQQVKSRAVGAVFDAIIKDTFKVIPFVVPPERLIDEFTDYAEPILKQIDCLLSSTEKLTQARDILLPKLMSGEIAV
ncbi:MAG TPA: restriction endonuclease subunit S [Gammaproteobacteria bacterium]|nr:restriction endonuclease subunit S [Gammaproteobacteria bacterium]